MLFVYVVSFWFYVLFLFLFSLDPKVSHRPVVYRFFYWAVNMHEGKIKQKPQQSVALLSKERKAMDRDSPGQRQGREEAQVSAPLLLLDACVGLGDPVISLCLNLLICRITS